MRTVFTIFHRWAGLFIALFLFIAGATGAVISWDHELDEWQTPNEFGRTKMAARSQAPERHPNSSTKRQANSPTPVSLS